MQMILIISALAFLVNLPAGYLRNRSAKYSLQWFFYIHLPIPVVVAARILSGTEYIFIPVFIASSLAGQFIGGRIERSGC